MSLHVIIFKIKTLIPLKMSIGLFFGVKEIAVGP